MTSTKPQPAAPLAAAGTGPGGYQYPTGEKLMELVAWGRGWADQTYLLGPHIFFVKLNVTTPRVALGKVTDRHAICAKHKDPKWGAHLFGLYLDALQDHDVLKFATSRLTDDAQADAPTVPLPLSPMEAILRGDTK